MVAGQMIDIAVEGQGPDIGTVTRLQRLKTGELIAFASEAGAIMGKASKDARLALEGYAHDLGLAFQMIDDLLDVEGEENAAGKALRKDAARGKATFVEILGAERARAQAELLAGQAARHLDLFDEKADLLRALADYVVHRKK
jgi:farnesyl diphosphate synthase